MSKYIDAEKLKTEIERRIEETKSMKPSFDQFWAGQISAFKGCLNIIDSLQQEQPEVDLKKEIDSCWQNWLSPSNQKEVEGVLPKTEFAMYARHFFELDKNSKWHD